MKVRRLIGLAALLCATIPAVESAPPSEDPRPAGVVWSQAMSISPGINAAAIAELYDKAARDSHHDLKGIVILREGRVVSERYYRSPKTPWSFDARTNFNLS
jgi:hypothetical protein